MGGVQLQIHKKVQAFFSMAVVAEVGNGARTLFWSDKWIHGRSVADIAPRVIVIVPKRRTNRRTALEALMYIILGYQTWKILSSGDSLAMASIRQNRLMQHSFRGKLPSIVERGFENLGHLESDISSCGWLLQTDVGHGLLIDLQDVAFSILLLAPIVTRMKKH